MEYTIPSNEIIDRQLLAYNARDIDAYCALFATDAAISNAKTGEAIAVGIDAIRRYYTKRFEAAKLRAEVKARIQLGAFVIDHEVVTGISDDDIQVVLVYEVRANLIQSVGILWP